MRTKLNDQITIERIEKITDDGVPTGENVYVGCLLDHVKLAVPDANGELVFASVRREDLEKALNPED